MSTIVIVEDEEHISKALKILLESEGYTVFVANDQKSGQIACSSRCPDLVLLDLGLPDKDGIFLIQEIRSYSDIPIIILSARDGENSKINALDLGADDYLTKPFSTSELLARIRAHLRTHNKIVMAKNTSEIKLSDSVSVDIPGKLVYKNGEIVHLTKIEFRLLCALIKEPNKVLTHRYLMLQVWGANYVEHQHYVRIYMAHLRQKLEDNPSNPEFLITEVGIGYRLILK